MNIAKDLTFPGLPADGPDGMCAANQMTAKLSDQAATFLYEMNDKTFKPHDAISVAEAFGVNAASLANYIGDNGFFSTIFDFSARELNEKYPAYYRYRPVSIAKWRDTIFASQERVNDIGFMCPIFENHDEPRGVFNSIYEFDDVNAKDNYKTALEAGLTERQALDILNIESRDNARTPMLWSDEKNAGFSTAAITWLKVHQDYKTVNVAAQRHDPKSVFSFYKALIALKKNPEYKELLTYGKFVGLKPNAEYVVPYARELNGKNLYVVANFEDSAIEYELPTQGKILLASNDAIKLEGTKVTLPAVSAVVVAD